MSYFEICNKSLYITLKEQEKLINECILLLDALKKRVVYLEDHTFLPIPENHEIFYEKVYVKNPMRQFPYVVSEILDNTSPADSISEGEGEGGTT